MKLRLNQVSYIGHLPTSKGLKPDSEKVKAKSKMPNLPSDVAAVRRLRGFLNYLSKVPAKTTRTVRTTAVAHLERC